MCIWSGRMSFIPRMAWIPLVDITCFLWVLHLHIFIYDLSKLSGNVVAFQGYGFLPIHVYRRYWSLARPGQADPNVCVLAFTRAVDHATHHRQGHILNAIILLAPYQHLVANITLNAFRQLLKI